MKLAELAKRLQEEHIEATVVRRERSGLSHKSTLRTDIRHHRDLRIDDIHRRWNIDLLQRLVRRHCECSSKQT